MTPSWAPWAGCCGWWQVAAEVRRAGTERREAAFVVEAVLSSTEKADVHPQARLRPDVREPLVRSHAGLLGARRDGRRYRGADRRRRADRDGVQHVQRRAISGRPWGGLRDASGSRPRVPERPRPALRHLDLCAALSRDYAGWVRELLRSDRRQRRSRRCDEVLRHRATVAGAV